MEIDTSYNRILAKIEEQFNKEEQRYYRSSEINKFILDNIDKFKEKFEKNVIRHEEGCWGWKGESIQKYPTVYYKIRAKAHRVSFTIENGLIPREFQVMHLCDNTLCTNPKHLKLGLCAENVAYIYEKNKPEYKRNLDENKTTRLSIDMKLAMHMQIKKNAADKNITMKKWVLRAITEKLIKESEYL